MSCPFSYYLQYGLKIKPQEELKIQTLNTGTFIHKVIDEFFENTKEEDKVVADLEKVKKELESKKISFTVKSGKDGKIFGTISSKQISEELSQDILNRLINGESLLKKDVSVSYKTLLDKGLIEINRVRK